MADDSLSSDALKARIIRAKLGLGESKPSEPSPTAGESFRMGVADPAVGLGQLGSRAVLDPPPITFTDEQSKAFSPETRDQTIKAVDESVRKREQDYQNRRGILPGTDWARGAGNLLSDVIVGAPLSVVAPEAAAPTVLGRVGQAAVGGAMGGAFSGAATPATGKNFAAEKAGQITGGAVTGAGMGGTLGALAGAMSKGDPQMVENFIKDAYTRYVKPTIVGKSNRTQADNAWDNTKEAMSSIVRRRNELELTDPITGQKVAGQLPQSLDQFSEAIDQTKRKIFSEYDAQKASAEASGTAEVTDIPKFRDAYAAAMQRTTAAEKAVREADQSVTLAAARQSRAGENVYMTAAANEDRKIADAASDKARKELERANSFQSAAKDNLHGAWVDLRPTVKELEKLSESKTFSDNPNAEAALDKAQKWVTALSERGAYTPSEAQDIIQNLNAGLKAFYRSPDYNSVASTMVDDLVANNLRKGIDEAITKATGPGYSALKKEYGALSSIEKEVVNRALISARQNEGGGILGNIGSIASAEEVIRGVVSLDPTAFATGVGISAFKRGIAKLRDPNRAVRRIFQAAEGATEAPTRTQQMAPYMYYATTPAGQVSGQAVVNTLGLR